VKESIESPVRTSISVVGSLTLAAVAFGAGAMIAMSRGWGEAIAIIDIVNATNQAVSMVTVQFDTCGYRGSIQAGALAPNASTQVRYMVCGEGGQTVTAQFADGTLLKSAAYVESGYRVTEKISRDVISQHTDLGLR
jgi:hypothetical protein